MIGPRLGEGREADVYAWRGDAVVKLYRPGYHGHRAAAAALATLDGHDVAPRLFDTVECDERTGHLCCWTSCTALVAEPMRA